MWSNFREIFCTQYNIGFGQPRSDTCSKCDELNVQLSAVDESEKDKVRKELELHHRKAEKGYKMLRDESQVAKESWDGKTRAFDREPCTIDATDVYTFDFQQNLPLPTLTVMCSIVNSGCITLAFMTVSDKGIMHLWDETTAK